MIPKKVEQVIGGEILSPSNPLPTESASLIQKFSYNSSKLTEFQGWAAPGSLAASSVWRIIKYTYNADFLVTDIQFADGDSNFDNVWDDRAGLDYS